MNVSCRVLVGSQKLNIMNIGCCSEEFTNEAPAIFFWVHVYSSLA
jgi:hypothetical protein